MSEIGIQELFCKPADERAVLHYCMQDLTSYFSVCSKLLPQDFLYHQHEVIMLIMESLASRGAEKFEPNMIISEATSSGVLDSIGGIKYVKSIANMGLEKSNLDVYLQSVVESSIKYKLYNLLMNKAKHIENNAKEGLTSADLLSNVESGILDLSMAGLNINEPINLAEGLLDYIDSMREVKIELSGLSTGYPILDKQIDGMVNGTLLVIAARKKMGKSTLLTNIAAHVAYNLNKPVLYVDTELSFKEWRNRALSTVSGVKERDIKHGGYDDFQYGKLKKAERMINKGKLFHEYMPGYSVDKLVALYKKYKHKEKLGLIVFDYLKEPDSSSVDRNRKEYQLLGDVTTKIKDLAGQLDIPALTAVQLNRDNDIADSDRIARYADVICFWETRKKEEMELCGNDGGSHKLVIKDTRRGGATSDEGIGYHFFKEFMKIREVPIDKQYFTNFNKVVNEDSSDASGLYDGYENEELR